MDDGGYRDLRWYMEDAKRCGIPERPKGGGHLAAMNCVGKLQRDLHQYCGILVKPLSTFFGYLPFDFIFKLPINGICFS